MTDNAEHYAAELFPTDYASWRYCIEVKCGLPLTPDYIQARIAVLADPSLEESRRFAGLYGEPYREQVLAWFRRAADEVR